MVNGQLELCLRLSRIWGLSCQRPNNNNLLPIHAILYRTLIIDRYSYLYSYSSTSTRTRTHVIIKYSDSYSYSHILQVLVLVLVLVNLVLAPALFIRLTSLALWQSNDCASASKATLMNMDKHFMWIHYERLHNHNKAKHNKTVCIFLGIYCKWQCCNMPQTVVRWCQ